MIVKLSSQKGWIYLEAARIEIELGNTIGKLKAYENNCEFYLRGVASTGEGVNLLDLQNYHAQEASCILLYDSLNNIQKIVTDLPGYLMNNDGKTIDRIN